MSKPRIGITSDSFDPLENPKAAWFSSYEYWYALRGSYASAVVEQGGIPFILPHHNDCIQDYIDQIDGLLITGGGFDVPPDYYGEQQHERTRLKRRRSDFEKGLTQRFLITQKPILGICGGMQLLAALFGGKLHQYLPDLDCKPHAQTTLAINPWHRVEPVQATKLQSILGRETFEVNSVHQQAVSDPGQLIVNAYADDGIIEGVEDPNHHFCIGVQWHPELFVTQKDNALIRAFVDASKRGD
ncbi:MAG: Putative glutamine amidotransferase [Holosporales bacterium]